ncbi:MAG: UDP-N-acetylmuramoyl-tripeptide--D-alanyl-D-alanine ligase [Thermodesulfobacteriota bacterium]|nr:UDP-N-acetylmuramoyl-tripeptide--D-alanyl-D-alanine ligase [Thermodesulfobacteriota bacterium]
MTFRIDEIIKATGGKLLQGKEDAVFEGISTDSRTVAGGSLFIALKGPRFDGHHYAIEALEKRAGGVVIEESKSGDIRWNGYRSQAVIAVKDTLHALGEIARDRRRKFGIPVVALTGSNGKTTTKEMISACLETTFPILKTKGNLNNLIGLPLTLLNLTGKERIVVLEMGMNVPGEIRRLTEIAEPDVGLITNIQKAHLEGMGSLEKIKEEKGALFRGMRKDGSIIVNQDDPRVVSLAEEFPGQKILFGIDQTADVMAREICLKGSEGTSFILILEGEEAEISLPLLGRHFVPNALSAIATASLFGVGLEKAKEALERFRPFLMRMEIISLEGGKTLINDAYNANPNSMELSLETLSESRGEGRAIAVLGDMLELGDFTEEAHRELGRKVGELSIDLLLAMGEEAPVLVESAIRHGFEPKKAIVVESHSEAVSILKETIRKGDWILVKGSRGMAMEKIVQGLRERREEKNALSSALSSS